MNRDFTTKKSKSQVPADFFGRKNFLSATIRVNLWWIFLIVFFSACSEPPKRDMRSLLPAETLVYIESQDLGEMLQALTENNAWENGASGKPDFSQLKNIQIAAAITGFESTEKQVAEQSAILNLKPHFVLIGDTHAWNSTAVSIVENQIGKFARETYGEDVKLEESDKQDAKFYLWTSSDGRKLFSAVSESLIYVGNNENLLDKCLSVKRGETDNLLKNENLASARARTGENPLVFGYVSPEGVAQIANLIGISAAIEASEENLIRGFVARILPDVLQKITKEVIWTARKTKQGIEDEIFVRMEAQVSSIFKETLATVPGNEFSSAEFLPIRFDSLTRYNLQNPQIAWRSVLMVASNQIDAASGRILMQYSNFIFEEPFGISDAETFLSAVGTEITTARFDEEGEKSVVIAAVKNLEKVKKAISDEINFKVKPVKQDAAEIWLSEDKGLAAAFVENKIILGERESVFECLQAKTSGKNFAGTTQFQNMANAAFAGTISRDADGAQKIIGVLGKTKENKNTYTSFYTARTRFVGNGFERKIVSDFGLLGTIIEKISDSEK